MRHARNADSACLFVLEWCRKGTLQSASNVAPPLLGGGSMVLYIPIKMGLPTGQTTGSKCKDKGSLYQPKDSSTQWGGMTAKQTTACSVPFEGRWPLHQQCNLLLSQHYLLSYTWATNYMLGVETKSVQIHMHLRQTNH